MTKEFRDKWATALRSGKYKQCYGRFRVNINESGKKSMMCCGIGVGLDTFSPNGWIENSVFINHPMHTLEDNYMDILGIPIKVLNCLFRMNDIEHASFNEIASYIESIEC